jgi:hypothetical protein
LAGVNASGSLTLNVLGSFNSAPEPTLDIANVLNVYSDAYPVPAGFSPALYNNQDIIIEISSFIGDEVIRYGNLGFVGIGWDNAYDLSDYDFLHIDIQVDQAINGGAVILELVSTDGTAGGNSTPGSSLVQGEWIGINIPVNGFTNSTGGGGSGSPTLNSISAINIVGNSINNVIVDNIYFYKE